MWAQRRDKLFLTIQVEDCKEPVIELKPESLHFKGVGGNKREYDVTIEFLKEVNVEQSKYQILPRNIPFVIKKKEEGPFWSRLLKSSAKAPWLKTDFDKWKDENDSDQEGNFEFDDMMGDMGRFGDMGGAGADDFSSSDSDDELPDLEDKKPAENGNGHGEIHVNGNGAAATTLTTPD
jgi:prostaglandin-E synthase